MDTTEPLPVRGARGKVEVTNPHGIFYKVLIDGEAVKPVKGRWAIPLRSGTTAAVQSRGILPGFQSLYVDDEKIYQFGADVPVWMRALAFLPVVLIPVNPVFGSILAVLLFFMNIMVIKNPEMPPALRVALPIINTAAATLALLLLMGMLG